MLSFVGTERVCWRFSENGIAAIAMPAPDQTVGKAREQACPHCPSRRDRAESKKVHLPKSGCEWKKEVDGPWVGNGPGPFHSSSFRGCTISFSEEEMLVSVTHLPSSTLNVGLLAVNDL